MGIKIVEANERDLWLIRYALKIATGRTRKPICSEPSEKVFYNELEALADRMERQIPEAVPPKDPRRPRYWLIGYKMRPLGKDDWRPANAVIDQHPAEWVIDVTEAGEVTREVYTLTMAVEITREEYLEAKDRLN